MDSQENRTGKKRRADEPEAIPGTDLLVRPVKDGDANRILALMREVFIDEMGWNRDFLVDAARTLVEVLGHVADPGTLLLVCCAGKKIVGVVTLLDTGGGTGFIRWLVVHRDVRGVGLGRLLLGRALAFARDRGFARVRLVTVRDLSRARDFYLKAGFREAGTRADVLWKMPLVLSFMEVEIAP
jgi:ribosomal protein S18 acetylase RimI-like enzyme